MEQIFEYNTTKLKELCEQNNVRQRHIMRLFNQTNSITSTRWVEGKPIHIDSLLKICQAFNLDFLSFIKYKGHSFTTKCEDLYRLEMAGYSLSEIMREKALEPIESEQSGDVIKEWHKSQLRDVVNSYSQMKEKSLTSIMEIVLKVQRECFEHEQESVKQLQAEYNKAVGELTRMITELKKSPEQGNN